MGYFCINQFLIHINFEQKKPGIKPGFNLACANYADADSLTATCHITKPNRILLTKSARL